MKTAVRDALNTIALTAGFAAALYVNDIIVERGVESDLLNRPEIVSKMVAQARLPQAAETGTRMQQALQAHWSEVSLTHVYAVRFDGSRFTSRLVHVADVATPKTLNLVATDYRCGYCKADRSSVDALLKANPNRDFVFIEAPVLGAASLQLAKEALLHAQHDEGDYYSIHNRQFDAPTPVSSEHGHADVELLTEQKRFLDAVGIFATPTYVREGVFRSGAIGASGG